MLEVFWYVVAATLAGVGTGLVGLSAATAMGALLIVLHYWNVIARFPW